jgi:hypothetical protein
MSRTRRLERFKLDLPETCDRWQHCSTAREPRDYTKGLGPLGRIGRISCVPQGDSQGSPERFRAANEGGPSVSGRAAGRPQKVRYWTDWSVLPMTLSLSLI